MFPLPLRASGSGKLPEQGAPALMQRLFLFQGEVKELCIQVKELCIHKITPIPDLENWSHRVCRYADMLNYVQDMFLYQFTYRQVYAHMHTQKT